MRQKSTIILGPVLALVLFASSVGAQEQESQEQEIRTTGGAFAGKFKFKEIHPSEALLEFPLAGRTVHNVQAGFIANSSYREDWSFRNSFLIYDRLPRRMAYRSAGFNERNAQTRFCGNESEQNCEVLDSDKRSRNLIIVTYRELGTGAGCAGLDYVGEDQSRRGAGLYGNYNVVISTCTPNSENPNEALARSAYYLSLIKRNGRPIANLARYNFPEPNFSGEALTTVETVSASVSANVRQLSDRKACENCDLSGAYLGATDLSNANLKGANLRGADLVSARLSGANLVGANIGGGANLSETDFSGANLTGADFRGTLVETVNFSGANLTGVRFGKEDALYLVNFSRANLDQVDLTGLDLSEATLRDTNLGGAILCKTKMPWGEENSGCK